jgi:hypothetical protein
MEQRLQNHLAALRAAEERSLAQIAALESENRQDEADLEKIRRNVYGICASLANADAAAARKAADPAADFAQRHALRLETFPQPWRQRREKAAAHGDVITVTIEETKLNTIAAVQAMFAETEMKP